MKTDTESPIQVTASIEAARLHVQITNQSKAPLAIWSDLDSINIPKNPPGDGIAPDIELTHVDFGVKDGAQFVKVAPGESVKVSLMLRDEQREQLQRVKAVKVPVKFRDAGNEKAEVKVKLVQGKVTAS